MDQSSTKMAPQTSLFQVFLRLRPPQIQKAQQTEPWLIVEPPATPNLAESEDQIKPSFSTHITLQPPNDSRKRAIERFGFTKIFQEQANQLDVFDESGTAESIRSLLQRGRDGLVATLGVTGSGKSHTILGTKSQRGLTQMALDTLFRSIGPNIRRTHHSDLLADNDLLSTLQSSDPSEAQIMSAQAFLDLTFDNGDRARMSRAQTPMAAFGSRAQTPMVRTPLRELPGSFPSSPPLSPSALFSFVKCSNIETVRESTLAVLPVYVENDPSTVRSMGPEPIVKSSLSIIPEHSLEREPWHPPSKVPFWSRLQAKRIAAKNKPLKETSSTHHARRPPMPRPSTFAHEPDVSKFTVDIDRDADYVVIVSMYEVYNDRIFDLLSTTSAPTGPAMSTRAGAALQKGLTRRPLLFKNTEMSQDRKVVAGLRKIVCSTYNEAMMVLEAGLLERRVAGTGSNSVSSRSHGFFCIEVKKNSGNRHFHSYSDWTGGTLSIVDLAGSERARNAKTTGSTLAEAGKINESLMYLGQCLQVQSDCQQDGSKPIVPFRQCKLTELLFSNSFPTQTNQNTTHKAPQKAIMIVTADPQGDFNATSQILRYSALAREVTVPRIPSVASVIISNHKHASTAQGGERFATNEQYLAATAQELEQATNEVQRLAEECDALAVRLTQEEIKRTEVELRLQAAEERSAAMELDIREECWQEMELMLEEEKERWRNAWDEQKIRGEEYLDGKIDILEKTSQFKIHSDIDNSARAEELERENEMLRAKLAAMEQEKITRSPTKRSKQSTQALPTTPAPVPTSKLILQESSNTNIATNPFLASLRIKETELKLHPHPIEAVVGQDIDVFEVSPRKLSLRSSSVMATKIDEPASVRKKSTRKLTTRKWDLGDENEI